MLLKVKYPFLIKYWVKYFLSKLQLLPLYIMLKFYTAGISIYLGVYLNILKTQDLDFCKSKLLSLYLQQSLQNLFSTKFRIYIFSSFNLLGYLQKGYVSLLQRAVMHKSRFIKGFKTIDFIRICMLSIYFRAPYLCITYLTIIFATVYKQKAFIYLTKFILENIFKCIPNLKGFQLAVKGKLGGITRTKIIVISKGKLRLSCKKTELVYAYKRSVTFTGLFGFKLWLNYRQ